MRTLPVIVALFLAGLVVAAQQSSTTPASAKASIEGIVVRAGSGEPIEGASVGLARPNPAPANPIRSTSVVTRGAAGPSVTPPPAPPPAALPAIPPVITDNAGRFVFNDLDAGIYGLTVFANGFARQNYGQRILFGPANPIRLTAGQQMKGIVMSMTATGSVNGHVRDAAGTPLADVPIQLLRATYNAAGQSTFQPLGIGRTNDRGEFRLYWVTPGRYYLNAGSPPGPAARSTEVGGAGASPNEVPGTSYVFTYYPNVADVDRASIVEVRAGEDTTGIDLVTSRQKLFRVRGRVVDASGQPPAAVGLSLAFRSLTIGGNFSAGSSFDPATGKFELRNVTPGAYLVQASLPDTTSASADAATKAAAAAVRPIARAPIEVSQADVEGVTLTLAAPASITGRLIAESGDLSAMQNWQSVRVQLRPSLAGVPELGPGLQQASLPPGADFRIDNVFPGEFLLSAAALPAGIYIKEAFFNQADALNRPLQFSGSASGTLDIVLSASVGQIDGIALDAQSKPVAGATAVLVPDTQRNRPELYKPNLSNAEGRFGFRNVAPGSYKLFVWEALEAYAFFDPDLIRRLESQGMPVFVTPSGKQTVQARAIPAGQ